MFKWFYYVWVILSRLRFYYACVILLCMSYFVMHVLFCYACVILYSMCNSVTYLLFPITFVHCTYLQISSAYCIVWQLNYRFIFIKAWIFDALHQTVLKRTLLTRYLIKYFSLITLTVVWRKLAAALCDLFKADSKRKGTIIIFSAFNDVSILLNNGVLKCLLLTLGIKKKKPLCSVPNKGGGEKIKHVFHSNDFCENSFFER